MPRTSTENTNELSEFEKQRLANIAERDALLKKLTLEAQSTGLFAKKAHKNNGVNGIDKSKSKKNPQPKIKKENEPPIPRRMSSRLRGLTAESDVAKRKADEEYDAAQEAVRAKRVRKSDTFTLDGMFVSGQKLTADALIGIDVITKGASKPYERTFGEEDVKKTTDKDLKALRENLGSLELWEAWEPNRLKMTPERVYAMTFHPSESKPLIFAGDKMGHLGVIDASQERPEVTTEEDDDPNPVITTLKPHTRTISAIVISPQKSTHIYTASYDSSIRQLDLEKMSSEEKYAPKSTSTDEPISGIDIAPEEPNVLYWTTLYGQFGRSDVRESPKVVTQWQLSEKKIGGFSLMSSQPHFFATASLDRFMRLWDLRKLSKSNPVPIGEHGSLLSVSHAAFNSLGHVATSSYDDSLKIYDFGKKGIASWNHGHTLSDAEMKPDVVVRHNCQTGRWVTILRPQWQQNPQSSPIQRFCIGNMNRFVDIYSSQGDQLAQLGGDTGLITAVPAVAVFHRTMDWVAGGTASGKLCLWK